MDTKSRGVMKALDEADAMAMEVYGDKYGFGKERKNKIKEIIVKYEEAMEPIKQRIRELQIFGGK